MENKNNTGIIGSGFLLGLLIGILVTLLITTKKGREILKELMDKAIKKISDFEESVKPGEIKKEIMHLATEFVEKKSDEKSHETESVKPEKKQFFHHKAQKKD
jgi:gas vesicle protein